MATSFLSTTRTPCACTSGPDAQRAIRQIEAKALRKLRHPSRSEKLRSFLEGE
jgi:hypothetical protein